MPRLDMTMSFASTNSPPDPNRLPRNRDNTQKSGVALGSPAMYTRKQAADRLGISLRSFDNLLAEGAVPKLKIRGSVRIEESELDAYLDRLRGNPAA